MTAMTFEEWCDYKKIVMGETPVWFRDPAERLRRYENYAAAADACCISADPRDHGFAITPDASGIRTSSPVAQASIAMARPRRVEVSIATILRSLLMLTIAALLVAVRPALAETTEQTVIVNGEMLTAQDQQELESVIGPLSPGRYWVDDAGNLGRHGTSRPIANLHSLVRNRMTVKYREFVLRQALQQQILRQQMMMQVRREAARQSVAQRRNSYGAGPSVQDGHIYGNTFSSGQRYGTGSWSHYNGYSNYGVGGTTSGCIYTPNWSNC